MAGRGQEPRPSWICRDAFERSRFLDLHARLLGANTKLMVAVVALIVVSLPVMVHPGALVPSAVGIALFAAVQRGATRFARPEIWVFWSLLAAEAMIVLALLLNGSANSAAMALVAWPVAGLAGRFHNRALVVGTTFAMAVVGAGIVFADPARVREDPLSLTLALAALAAVSLVAAAHRDSDIANRGAAILDPLTGMLNRNALLSRTAEVEHQSAMTRQPVGLIIADIDHFKHVNDTYGHGVGDAVLRDVAYVLRRELRAYDLAYRLGGEEFVILVLGAQAGASAELAERLRSAVAAETFSRVRVTISLGVAATRLGDAFTWKDLFARADAALYDAKRRGRDRVAVAGREVSRFPTQGGSREPEAAAC